jgi:hypothetical protein
MFSFSSLITTALLGASISNAVPLIQEKGMPMYLKRLATCTKNNRHRCGSSKQLQIDGTGM